MTEKTIKNWAELQSEISVWTARNFGNTGPEFLLHGVVEEISEFLEADRNKIADSIGDQAIYLLNLCSEMSLLIDNYGGADINFVNGFSSPYEFQLRLVPDDNFRTLLIQLGKTSRSIIKTSQSIRGHDKSTIRTEVGNLWFLWGVWARSTCNRLLGSELIKVVNDVWNEVKLRNWKVNPLTGNIGCFPGKPCCRWPECEVCGPPRL